MTRYIRPLITICAAVFLLGLAALLFTLPPSDAVAQAEAPVSEASETCLICHTNEHPGIVDHWQGSSHAEYGIGCYECHLADPADADAFDHHGYTVAVVVTPRDCSGCHNKEYTEFVNSHHADGGMILDSLDNFLAETVEGARGHFAPVSATPGRPDLDSVNGQASAVLGCLQCHGSKLALQGKDGTLITVDELQPGVDGQPQNAGAVANIAYDDLGRPLYAPGSWPNTGIGRINLDGTRGSCTACHSRHDFSARRARTPDNCGKCHQGPDHPQREVYEESKHGIAFLDMHDEMSLEADSWILGEDYSAAPTCATCHMGGNESAPSSHDVGHRLSWNNKAVLSRWYDTDAYGNIVSETGPDARAATIEYSAWDKRAAMKDVCITCHAGNWVDNWYVQYDDFIHLYNEKFGKPGAELMALLKREGMVSAQGFDEEIEWVWWELWHHEGRRARHGASMMGPDYAHWHGLYEVARAFYMELVPEAYELAEHARAEGNTTGADAVEEYLDALMARQENEWIMAE